VNGQARALLEGVAAPVGRTAPWVAVSGGKGGVGKTLLAVNLALGLRRLGLSTLLVDFDPGLGNVDVHLRLAARHDLEDLADGTCAPHQAVVDGPGRLRVVLGRSGSPRLAHDASFRRRALDAVGDAGREFDVVVCDTGAGIGPAVLDVCQRAHLTLAVTTPEPAAVTDAYALAKVLHKRGLPLPHLVVNQAANVAVALRTAERLGAAAERFLAAPWPHLGSLRRHASLARAVLTQRPLIGPDGGEPADELRTLAVATAGVLELPSTERAPRSLVMTARGP